VLLSVPLPRLWDSVGSSLKAVQTVASTMEILHVLLRWVPSSLATNVMQALARHMSLWLVLDLNFNTPHNSSSVIEAIVGPQWNTKEVWLGATVTAWACVEVVRYSMYVSELLGFTPSILKFLRYNAFIVLYPLGFVGEVCGLLLALPHYRSGLCPPSFPQCATNSLLLYVAYFYLITSVPGNRSLHHHALIRDDILTYFCRLSQALHAHVCSACQAIGQASQSLFQ
jgi:hypothetical protein